jgi:hypothetical protein
MRGSRAWSGVPSCTAIGAGPTGPVAPGLPGKDDKMQIELCVLAISLLLALVVIERLTRRR